MIKSDVKEFVNENKEELFTLIKELCAIPAPSHFEHKRAEFCKAWLEGVGAEGVYIDEVQNVIYQMNCEESDDITVFVAHTDTVFPDTEPMPYIDDGEKLRSPGVGDDTASLAVLLLAAKFFTECGIDAPRGVMFVCNSCEEGLGNLLGTRQIFKDFEGRIGRFISFDGSLTSTADVCVGSCRYNVEVLTEGGHSYGVFGKKNAIAELSKIINEIYKIEVPQIENSKTTYNVGTISGGTSVNTIAQSASMLCEYRSTDEGCLEIMKEKFLAIFDAARSEEVEVVASVVGERPCMKGVDTAKVEELARVCGEINESITGVMPKRKSSSTDCNIPLSIGIPAICIGVYRGGGAHTREEWVEKASVPVGLEVGIKVIDAVVKL